MDFLQSIGILDIVFIAILVISILVGLIRGAIREVLSLVGLAIAIYLALSFSETLSKDYVSKFFEDAKVSYIISFILIIVAAIFAIALFNLFLSQLLKASGLSFINRLLGMAFGVIRGVLICSIITLAMNFIPGIANKSWWKASATAPIFHSIANQMIAYLPKEINNYLDSTKNTVGEVTQNVISNAVKENVKQNLNKGTHVTPEAQGTQTVQPIILESAPAHATEKTETNTNNRIILESFQESN